jgi:hypothetical protein
MEQMATNGDRHSQQQQELHHRFHPKRITNRVGTSSSGRTAFGIKEPNRGRIPVQHVTKQTNGHPRAQQSRSQSKCFPKSLVSRAARMARRKEPAVTPWHCQTCTPTTRPLQSHSGHIPSNGSTQPSPTVENSPGLPRQSANALH